MLDWLLAPLQYEFMVRGLLAAVMVGIVCAVLGTYVVLRGMAFFGDAVAHAVLPGLAVAYLIGGGPEGPLFWGGLVAGVGTAMGIGAISRGGHLKEDTAIGVIFAGMFALGVALISTTRNFTVDLTHFLFGNVLGVSAADLRLTAVFGALVLLLIVAFYKEFLVISFDPVLATILRLPTQFFRYLLLVMIAVTIVIALQTVGVGASASGRMGADGGAEPVVCHQRTADTGAQGRRQGRDEPVTTRCGSAGSCQRTARCQMRPRDGAKRNASKKIAVQTRTMAGPEATLT